MIIGKFISPKKRWITFIEADVAKGEDVVVKITELEKKVGKVLVYSNTFVFCSYAVLIITLLNMYGQHQGKHFGMLLVSLVSVFALFFFFLYNLCKYMVYHHKNFKLATITYLDYQMSKLTWHRKIVALYILTYSVLLFVAGSFFLMDNKHGLTDMLKNTAPLSILTYLVGIYLIVSFTRQKNKHKTMYLQFKHIMFVDKISQN